MADPLTPEQIERRLRQELWLGHGHRGLYGDDGEMQCGECIPFGGYDYKRLPIADVIQIAERARLAGLVSGVDREQEIASHAKQEALREAADHFNDLPLVQVNVDEVVDELRARADAQGASNAERQG